MNNFTQIVYTIGRKKDNSMIEMLGTGFLISNNGKIAVPKHIIGDNSKNLLMIKPHINNFNQYQDVSANNCSGYTLELLKVDPIRDIAILKGDFNVSGKIPKLSNFDNAVIGDEVGIFGYPHCVEGRRCLTFQKAEIGAKILLENFSIKSKYAVINTQTRPGQSGSLIYSFRTNEILGMLIGAYAPSGIGLDIAGINPKELHQTTQCISSEYINNML